MHSAVHLGHCLDHFAHSVATQVPDVDNGTFIKRISSHKKSFSLSFGDFCVFLGVFNFEFDLKPLALEVIHHCRLFSTCHVVSEELALLIGVELLMLE